MPVLTPYASLVDLLGKPHEDLTITSFIEQLGERPRIHPEEHTCTYHFSESGFEIMALKNDEGVDKHIYAVTFFVDTRGTRDGSIKPYCYEFISGVTPNDSLNDVRNKISLKPQIGLRKQFRSCGTTIRTIHCNFIFANLTAKECY